MNRPDPYPVVPLDGPLDATVELPGSKSITNRALVCAALADGTSTLRGVLDADDTTAMARGLRALGADITILDDVAIVHGTAGALPAVASADDSVTVDADLSGTTARFLLAVAALAEGTVTVDGGAPLRERPVADGVRALVWLGRDAVASEGDRLPVTVRPDRSVDRLAKAIAVRGDVSSQFLTGLLLAAPCLPEGLEIVVDGPLQSRPYVDMTLAVMAAFGVTVDEVDTNRFRVPPGGYRAADHRIEPDASAASYFFAAAALCGGTVTVPGLGSGSLQGDLRFVEVLRALGADVEVAADRTTVRGGRLGGGLVEMGDISDTAQTLAAIAPCATGPITIEGIGFIRRKETDRIAAVVTELRRLGVDAVELDDGLRVEPGPVAPGVVQTYHDHRMAMSFAVLGLRVAGVEIADPGCVSKTFPTFWDVLDEMRGDA